MNKAFNFLIVVALLLGVGCIFLIKFYVDTRVNKAKAAAPVAKEVVMQDVLFAKEQITLGSEFTNFNTELRSIPEEIVPPTAIKSLEELNEQIALHVIPVDDMIMQGKFGKPSALPKASAVIPEGKRLVTISVDDRSAAGYTVKNGDFVDLVGIFTVEGSMLEREQMPIGNRLSVTFLQRVEIFDIIHGQTTSVDTSGDNEGGGQDDTNTGRLAQGTTATFLVTPKEAEVILAADTATEGMFMVLRRYDDDAIIPQPSSLHERIADLITGDLEQTVVEQAPVADEPVAPQRKTVF